ncbi:MAG: FAD-dependent oxidoreductase [Candidatus Eisenbacteria bacterium]|nr:FAD-dependent oxidoreductase [Candidatus Latescibacterota bacterium]MBD3302223.1 FAD-dependent oxidoreductase [Candidatus Eisenbacteria bacterium]
MNDPNDRSEPTESPDLPERVDVAVIGGGLSGLICARALSRAGRDVHVFEAEEEIGGRMRTERHREGFLLDHGFHVTVTGYPSFAREIDAGTLDLQPFDPGCLIARAGRLVPLTDPERGGSLREALAFPLASLGDKWKLRGMRNRLRGEDEAAIRRRPDRAALDHLRGLGFSEKVIGSFFVPFFRGVFLDPDLGISSRYFESVFKALDAGPVGIPAAGTGAIPRQVAAAIPDGAIHTSARVDGLLGDGDAVEGIRVGEREVRAERTVLAVEPSVAAELSGLEMPEYAHRGVTVCYFTADRPPTEEKRLVVVAEPGTWTSHFAVLSNVAPALAPEGRHLLMGAILGTHDIHDGDISEKIRHDMAYYFPHGLTHTWRWLRTVKLPHAQWALEPGMAERLPEARTRRPGLVLAGDLTREPSVEGAIRSGLEAAEAVAGN